MADIRIIPALGAVNVTGSADFRGTGASSVLFVSGSGNVGVGTTNPTSKLHIAGAIKATSVTGHVFGTSTDTSRALSILNSGLTDASTYAITLGYGASNNNQAELSFYLNQTGSVSNRLSLGLYNSSNTLNILGNGRVGIGKTNPAALLDVYSPTQNVVAYFESGDQEAWISIKDSYSSGYGLLIGHSPNDGEHFKVSAGNTANLLKLDNTGSLRLYSYGSGTNTGTAAYRLAVDSSGNIIEESLGAGAVDGLGSSRYLARWEDTDTLTSSSLYEDTNGNIGIGVTNPDVKFQVQGGLIKAATSDYAAPSTGGAISMFQNSNDYGTIWSVKNYNGAWGNVAISPLGGNVGVGNSTPLRKLHVVGDLAVNASGSQYYGVYINGVGEGADPNILIGDWHNASANLTWDSSARAFIIDTQYSTGAGTFKITGNDQASTFLQIDNQGDVTIYNDLNVDGIITAREFHTTFISASIIYQSGSTQFGNSSDDTHIFTGNVAINTTSSYQTLTVNRTNTGGAGGYLRLENTVGGAGANVGVDFATFSPEFYSAGTAPTARIFATDISNYSGRLDFNIRGEGVGGTLANVLTLHRSTNVGIGSTAPEAKLDVNGASILARGAITIDPDAIANSVIAGGITNSAWGVSSGIGGRAAGAGDTWAIGHNGVSLYFGIGDGTNANSLATYLRADADRSVALDAYGSGTFTGTAAYNLSVDSSGNIIETANPSLTGTGTANYVTKWSDSDTITNSSIYDNGSVGIATTSPGTRLHVIANESSNGTLRLQNSSNTGYSNIQFHSASGAFMTSFGYINNGVSGIGGRTLLDLDNNGPLAIQGGSVGIGTTSPSTKLHLYDASDDVVLKLHPGDGGADSIIELHGQGGDLTTEGFQIWYDNNVGDVHLGTTFPNDAAAIRFHTRTGASKSTSNERMTIAGNGNVGISTTSPGAKLHIKSTADADILLEGSSQTMRIDQNSIRTTTASQIAIFTNNTLANGLYINSAGNIGVGMSAPTALLHVSRSLGAAWLASFENQSVSGHGLLIRAGGTSGTRYITQWKDAAGTERFHMQDTGEMYAPNIGAGTDDSVVVLNSSGYFKTDEIDSRVWGSTLVDGSGTAGYVTKWSDANTLANSIIYDNGSSAVHINGANPLYTLDVNGIFGVGGGTNSSVNYIYDAYTDGNSAYYHQPQASIRLDSSATGSIDEAPVSLFLHNENGADNTWVKLSMGSREASGAGNTVSLAGIAAQKTSGTANAWASGDLHLWTKSGPVQTSNMIIKSNGNVGVGSTAPVAKLDIYQSGSTAFNVAGSQGQLFSVTDELSGSLMSVNDISGIPILEVFSDDRVVAGQFGTNALVVNGANVGVGTATPAYKLDVAGTVQIQDSLYLGKADTASGHINAYELMTFNIDTDNDDADTRYFGWFKNGAAGSGTALMRLTETGNLGIGTTAPAQELHIKVSSGNADVRVEGPTATNYTDFYRGDSDGGIYIYGDTDFKIGTNAGGGSNMFVADVSTGRIGINTATPGYRLDVNGDGRFTGAVTMDSNLTVNGIITAREFHTTFVSASIIYQSGSTQFGNSNDDTHEFYGTVGITGTSEQNYLEVDAIAGFAGISSASAAMVEFLNSGDGNTLFIKTNNSARTDAAPLAVWTQNNPRFIVRNDGNVGIGTTNPNRQLTFGSKNEDAIQIRRLTTSEGAPAAGTGISWTWTSAGTDNETWAAIRVIMPGSGNSNMTFSTTPSGGESGLTERMRITDTGNVGIGTTVPAAKLHVSGGDAILRNAFIGEVPTYTSVNAQFSHISRAGAGEYSFLSAADGTTFVNAKTGQDIYFRINNSNVATIKSDGNVGIGTDAPSQKLDVRGNIYGYGTNVHVTLNAAAGSNYSYIELQDGGSSNGYLIKNTSSSTSNGALAGALYTYTDNNKAFHHVHAGTPLFTILSGGNTGIGTVAPAAKLHVVGDAIFQGLGFNNHSNQYNTSTPGITSFGASALDSSISYYDTTINFPNNTARGIVWTGKHYIITDHDSDHATFYDNNFTQISNVSGSTVVSLPLPSTYDSPHGAAWDGRYLYCLLYGGGQSKIVGYDVHNGTTTATIVAESAAITDYAAAYDIEYAEGHLYVIDSGKVFIYKLEGKTITKVRETGAVAGSITAQAITYDGSYLWATQNSANVYKLKLDGTLVNTLTTGYPPDNIGWTWNGENIVALDYTDGDISVLNTSFKRIDTETLALMGGNVGIGITNPGAKLSVYGTGTAGTPTLDVINTSSAPFNHSIEAMTPNMTAGENNIIVIGRESSTKNSGYIGYKYSSAGANANVLTFGHWGSDNLMNLTGDGNVGIGTTNPQGQLSLNSQIPNSGTPLTYSTVQQNVLNGYYTYGESPNLYMRYFDIACVGDGDGTNGGGNIRFLTNPIANDTAVERMRITSDGNVGIGTTNPSRRLTVMTSPQAAMTAGAASGHFFLTNTGGSSGLYGLYGGVTSDGDGWFQSARNDSATYYNLLLQANGGNVGIGTTSPASKLHVNPATVNEIAIAINGTQNYSANSFQRISAGDASSLNRVAIGFGYNSTPEWAIRYSSYHNHEFFTGNDWGSSTEKMRITSAGALLVGTTSTTNTASGKIVNRTTGTSNLDLGLNGGAWSIASIGAEPALYLSSNIVAATGTASATQTAKGGIGFEYVNAAAPTDLVLGIFGSPTVASSVRIFNNTERIRITSAGDVGIGTTSPGTKLHVSGGHARMENGGADAYYYEGTRTGVGTTLRLYDNANNIYIDGWQSVNLRANQIGGSGGGIGLYGGPTTIGTIDAATSDLDKFLVSDTGVVKYRTGAQVLSDIGAQASGNYVTDAGGAAGQLGVWSSATAMSGSNALYWNGSNVGIGTPAPANKLHVEGSVLINSGTGASTFNDLNIGGISGWSTNEAHRINFVYNTAASPTIYQTIESWYGGSGQGKMRFRNFFDNTPQTSIIMTVVSNGNVGIGDDDPAAKLEVAGETRATSFTNAGALGTGAANARNHFTQLNAGTASPATGWIAAAFGDASADRIVIGQWTSGTKEAIFGAHNGNLTEWADTQYVSVNHKFYTNGAWVSDPSVIFASTGNVGIGSDSPVYKLDVNGGSAQDVARFYNSGNTTTRLHFGDTGNTQYTETIYYSNDGLASIFISGTGHSGYGGPRAFNIYNEKGGISLLPDNATSPVLFATGSNVGIGITAPAVKLHVASGGIRATGTTSTTGQIDASPNFGAFRFYDGSTFYGGLGMGQWAGVGANTDIVQYLGANVNYHVSNTTTPVLTVSSAGNVGIGVTVPLAKLDVRSQVMIGDASIGGAAYQTLSVGGDMRMHGTYRIQFGSANSGYASMGITGTSTGTITFRTWDGSADQERLRIVNNTGNVGIGSTSPEAKLDVYQSGSTALNIAGSQGQLFSVTDSLSGSLMSVNDISGIPILEVFSDDRVVMGTFGQDTLVVNGSNVGVGTATPGGKLHIRQSGIADNTATTLLLLDGQFNDSSIEEADMVSIGFRVENSSGGSQTSQAISFAYNNYLSLMKDGGNVGIGSTAPAYKLDVTGTIRATGDVIAYSDRRVKQDIVTLENSVELIQKLRGVSYKKIGESEEKIGVIAQEILEVLPQVVSKDENGMYSVAYGNMAGLFIEAIKEQQHHIESLEDRIQKLEQLLTQKP
jgi:hypothetical protein